MATCASCGAQVRDNDRFCAGCGQTVIMPSRPAAALADPYVGKVFSGRYRAVRLLGRGGMGSVYLGEQTNLQQNVAIKILHAKYASEPELVQRFHNEARVYCKLTDPHAVKVHDFGQSEDGALFLVMEYVDGVTLQRHIESNAPLSFDGAARLGLQVCEGLSAAHRMGIVHRDLKPQNIMLIESPPGRHFVKILDFGIARVRGQDSPSLTATGAVFGTPEYMAPEQAKGEPTDARSDIYALGIILYAMTTGKLPFSAETPLAIMNKHAYEPPPPPESRRPGMPPRLAAAIMRCLEKDPKRRFQSLDDMHADLERWQETPPAAALDPTLTARALAPSRRGGSRRAVIAAAIVLVAAAGGVAAYLATGGRPDAQPTGGEAVAPVPAQPTPQAPGPAPEPISEHPPAQPPPSPAPAMPSPEAARARALLLEHMHASVSDALIRGDLAAAAGFCTKVLDVDPADEQCKAALKTIETSDDLRDQIAAADQDRRCEDVKRLMTSLAEANAAFAEAVRKDLKRCGAKKKPSESSPIPTSL